MSDAASLVERYRGAAENQTNSAAEQLRAKILRSQAPDWSQLAATRSCAPALRALDIRAPALAKKAAFEGQQGTLAACLAVVGQNVEAAQWVVTLLSDMLREDCSCFCVFEEALHKKVPVYQTLFGAVSKSGGDQYVADKAAWLLSSVIGNMPLFYSDAEVQQLVKTLSSSDCPCSELGVLDAYVNLLKADGFRILVWKMPGVSEIVSSVSASSAPPPYLYKCVFAMWLVSFEDEHALDLHPDILVRKVKDVLANSRVEKVVRLSLTVLKNFLARKAFSEQVVEQGLLEVVQQLEYEKWRDAELYDDIRDLAAQISQKVGEMSNFDRYLRELNEGTLKWGFIHSSKFWADNATKFEQHDYKALKDLAKLLRSRDTTTLAVACHDLGEFVVCHPLGKKVITQLGCKEPVMDLMACKFPEYRDVRREALLCCQKFMLNKWGDMDPLAA